MSRDTGRGQHNAPHKPTISIRSWETHFVLAVPITSRWAACHFVCTVVVLALLANVVVEVYRKDLVLHEVQNGIRSWSVTALISKLATSRNDQNLEEVLRGKAPNTRGASRRVSHPCHL